MEEKKSIKVSLVTVICMFIILILIFALIVVYYFGFVADKKEVLVSENNLSEEIQSNTNDKTIIKPAKYMIQFDSKLLGEEFNQVGNEILECDYEISFLENNKFTISMNFGNTVSGTYSVTDDDKIICNITEASGEYSPEQKINAKITLKINSDSEIEITEAPESYTIRIGETTAEGWKLSEETKEMSFWPLVKGIKYSIIK